MNGVRFALRYHPVNAAVLGVLGMGRGRSEVVVGADTVRVRMGWAFSTEIDRSSINASHDDRSVWGWGVHGWRSRWLVNGSSRGLVRLDIEPAARAKVCGIRLALTELRISVDDPDGLIDALT
jgi:hypothetical protein